MTSSTRTNLSIALLIAAALAARSDYMWVDVLSAALFGAYIWVITGFLPNGATPNDGDTKQ